MAAVAQQSVNDPPGTRIAGRYRVIAALGRGGMSHVYRALDETTGARVALKRATFPKERASKLAASFEREYQTLAVLDHPCIIRVHDFGRDERGPYYTMELLEGQGLRELSPLPFRDACRYMRDVASSLALLHARRLVHRDVSPANVRIASDDHAKLIDFGALAPFGASRDVTGTPPCVPPEAYRGEPLDQRSDLYAFGATLFFALTGRHAYPVRELAGLPAVWATPPEPPSAHVAGIPEALDDLVLSLLSSDPNVRPQTAAVVIDRLSVIADLGADGTEHNHAEAYLRSAPLIGRERELSKLDHRLEQLARGHKDVLLFTGTTGIGKSRLLVELAVRARLANVKVLSASAESHREPYGVVRKLALDLLDVAPELAARTAEPFLSVLGHVLPELRDGQTSTALEPLARDGAERRARLQRALGDWLAAVTQAEPFVLAVDNADLADESSIACLTSLARSEAEGQCLIVLTLDLRYPRATSIAALIPRESTLAIAPLSYAHVEELMRSLFGDVAHVPQVARVLHEATLGNPGNCLQLARHLIRSGHVSYEGGAWLLPQELRREDLPSGEEVQLTRFRKLDASVRELAMCLSMSRTGMPLSMLAKLSTRAETLALRQLDGLVSAELVRNDAGTYRFSNEGLRTRVLSGLDPKAQQALELALARTLDASEPNDPDAQLESGYHLLRSGDVLEGARRMAAAATKIIAERAPSREALSALLLALEALEAHAAPEAECLALRALILTTSFDVDHRVAVQHGLETMDRLQRYLGFSAATRLTPLCGEWLALRLGTNFAVLRHVLKRRPRAEIMNLYRLVFGAWLSSVGVAGLVLDPRRIDQLVEPMRVIRSFGSRSFPAFALTLAERIRAQTHGREHDAEQLSLKALDTLRDERVSGGMPQAVVHTLRGGVLFGLGLTQVFRGDGSALRTAQALSGLGLAMYEVVATQIAMIAHAYRGEAAMARNLQRRVETLALRGGSTWQTEVFAVTNMLTTHYLTGDVVGAKQARQQLARLSTELPTLSGFATLANGIAQLHRGRFAEAIAALEPVMDEFAPRARNGWAIARAALAAAYTGDGKAERAERLCREALPQIDDDDRAFPLMYVHIERELARAESALGHHDDARARLGALLERYASADLPLLLGLLHRDGVELALAAGETHLLSRHLERARHYLRLTTHSGLIASVEHLAKRVERARTRSLRSSLPARSARTDALLRELQRCTDGAKRAQLALVAIVESAGASAGFLVLFAGDAPYVAAAVNGEPPEALLAASALVREHELELPAGSAITDGAELTDPAANVQMISAGEARALTPYPLMAEHDRTLVGIAWLTASAGVATDDTLLHAAAQALRPL